MEPAPGVRITVTKNGPYFVDGVVPLTVESIVSDDDGESESWKVESRLADRGSCGLCRCGQSDNKPLCDGSHASSGFDGTETASREPYAEAAVVVAGPRYDLADDRALCSDARFCHRSGAVWHRILEDSDEAAEIVREECELCPSGRYVVTDKVSRRAARTAASNRRSRSCTTRVPPSAGPSGCAAESRSSRRTVRPTRCATG